MGRLTKQDIHEHLEREIAAVCKNCNISPADSLPRECLNPEILYADVLGATASQHRYSAFDVPLPTVLFFSELTIVPLQGFEAQWNENVR